MQSSGVAGVLCKQALHSRSRSLPVAQLQHHLHQLLRHDSMLGVTPQPVLQHRPCHSPAAQLSSLHALMKVLVKRGVTTHKKGASELLCKPLS